MAVVDGVDVYVVKDVGASVCCVRVLMLLLLLMYML